MDKVMPNGTVPVRLVAEGLVTPEFAEVLKYKYGNGTTISLSATVDNVYMSVNVPMSCEIGDGS